MIQRRWMEKRKQFSGIALGLWLSALAGQQAQAQVCNVSVMPLGDSITEGVKDPGDAGDPPNTGYRDHLYQALVEAYPALDFVGSLASGPDDGSFDRDHEGHAGKNAEWVADRTFDFLTANPADVVLLHIGTNGLGPVSEVARVLDEIDRFDTAVHVILAQIIDAGQPDNPDHTAFNQALATMANNRIANGDIITLVNMQPVVAYPSEFADIRHPNDTGYQKMATAWFGVLEPVLATFCEDQLRRIFSNGFESGG